MQREFSNLTHSHFDVLIIGGGITGAWTAYDAARRGLKVAIVDKNDWGSGTSQSSSKMIHGGLRYLENFEFGLVQQALKERKALSKIAPHRIGPVKFVLPTYKGEGGWFKHIQLKAGLTLYDTLAGGKQPVDKHEMLSRKKMLARFPYLNSNGLQGGFTYGDCQEDDARMTLEIIAGAIEYGAVAVNHAKVAELIFQGDTVLGAVVEDRWTQEQVAVHANLTVNAAGPWARKLIPNSAKPGVRLVKGSHLVMPALPSAEGAFITSPDDGRVMFLIPWYGRTLLGTTDIDYSGDPTHVEVSSAEVGYMLRAANRTLGENYWTEEDILGRYAGVRTLEHEEGADATQTSREWNLFEPYAQLLMPVGGKYTTARVDAEQIVDRVFVKREQASPQCVTSVRPLPWAPLGDYTQWHHNQVAAGQVVGLDAEVSAWAARRYGIQVSKLHAIIVKKPELKERVVPSLPFCFAELVYAVEYEMAETLDDVLRRRIPLTLLGCDAAAQTRCEELLAGIFGWEPSRMVLRLQ